MTSTDQTDQIRSTDEPGGRGEPEEAGVTLSPADAPGHTLPESEASGNEHERANTSAATLLPPD